MISCDNYLCLYWVKQGNDGKCISDDIELDVAGVCQSCIYFINENDELDELRRKNLEKEKN